MGLRLGELLVQFGALTPEQCDQILEEQNGSARPFGLIAEEMFGVSPKMVEQAWAFQYATIAPRLDPRQMELDEELVRSVSRRQAWQFGIIPVRWDGAEALFVTAQDYLARAMRFVGWRVPAPVSFALCTPNELVTALEIHYPLDGMSIALIDEALRRSPAA